MNYRHAFHAGNFADVFKHIVLVRILTYLTHKDAAFRFIDTHAGLGLYDLSAPESLRSGEWRQGVGRLASARWSQEAAALLAPYLEALGPFGESGAPKIYPGSPIIAQHLLRKRDRMIFCEAHPKDARSLKKNIGRDIRAKAIEIDGYVGLRAYVPPVERRGLVHIDPPFEERDEFERLRDAFLAAWAKWPTGVYMIWRPLKDLRAARAFDSALLNAGARNLLRLDLNVAPISEEGPLAACGLLVINPPFTLEAEAAILLPELAQAFSRAEGSGWSVRSLGAE